MFSNSGRLETRFTLHEGWAQARLRNAYADNAAVLTPLSGIDGAVPANFPASLGAIREMSANVAGGLLQACWVIIYKPLKLLFCFFP